MIRFSFKALVAILALNLCAPTLLRTQPHFVIRPQFDETSSHRGLYLHKVPRRPKVALVLSGGGARGVAQIGVLKVLERNNIPVDFIVATSLGAVVGGLYASGYTPSELEHLALSTNWDELLSLSGETRRRDLFIDQKIADDRSFFAIRFQGLEPVIPSAVSSGQRLTDFLSTQTLQALYHPNPTFDDLKVHFRSVTTDLISGKRFILREGSLAEALRASATVPLLFSPIEKDSMQLIDGGLVSNIPVDVARSEGYDIIIAVNSTSGLRNKAELKAPWQAADQIMGIMMQTANEQQLKLADIVITPEIGRHLSSDFSGLDSLIEIGELAAQNVVGAIQSLYALKYDSLMQNESGFPAHDSVFSNAVVAVSGSDVPDSLRRLLQPLAFGSLRLNDVRKLVNEIYAGGSFSDVFAEVVVGLDSTHITYHLQSNPELKDVQIRGCRLLSEDTLRSEFLPLLNKPMNTDKTGRMFENMLRLYRSKGYSLARLDSVQFNSGNGILYVHINEGIVDKIDVQGGVRTEDYFVLREFPLEEGEVFEIDKANTGLVNINSSKLFDYVYLEVSYPQNKPLLTVRLRERPSQLVRLGIRADNERYLQGSLDIRDENFHGTGSQLGFTIAGGGRNREFILEYKAFRIFDTYLTFSVSAFHSLFDTDVYSDVPGLGPNRFDRERVGEYRDIRTGGRFVFGSQLERLGNATIEFSAQDTRIKNLENLESLAERYLLTLLKIGTTIDTKDLYPFPTSGIGFNVAYEIASKRLGSEVSYNALRVMYESYSSWGNKHTLHPRVTLGVADRTTPLGQQFRFGGQNMFFGLHEDDRRGRQLLLINLEYRYRFPIRILFDTYFRFRYDLGSISLIPEEIKLSTFRHGLGAEVALDTPIGAALFGIGKSFYFVRDLPQNPLKQGPFMLYFTIGYQF